MFDTKDPLRLEWVGPEKGGTWILHESLEYFDEDTSHGPDGAFIEVPEGFVTDLASIPRVLWVVFPKAGPYTKSAVLHDWLYWDATVEGRPITRSQADAIFKRAMASEGVGAVKRNLVYAAVRAGGGRIWAKYRACER